jgi:hypothetical protein
VCKDLAGNEVSTFSNYGWKNQWFETPAMPETAKPNVVLHTPYLYTKGDNSFNNNLVFAGGTKPSAILEVSSEQGITVPFDSAFVSIYQDTNLKGTVKFSELMITDVKPTSPSSTSFRQVSAKDATISGTKYFKLDLPIDTSKAGKSTVRIELNKDRTITESSYSDNYWSGYFTFETELKTDLEVKDYGINTGSTVTSLLGSIPVKIRVSNQGSKDTNLMPNQNILMVYDNAGKKRYYTTKDLPAKDIFGDPTNGQIPAGSPVEFTYNYYPVSGKNTINVQADPDNAIAESNENNNFAYKVFTAFDKAVQCGDTFSLSKNQIALLKYNTTELGGITATNKDNEIGLVSNVDHTGEMTETAVITVGDTHYFSNGQYGIKVNSFSNGVYSLTMTKCPSFIANIPGGIGGTLGRWIGYIIFQFSALVR